MNEDYKILVTEEFNNERLDKFLSTTTNISRTRIQQLIEAGCVQRNGEKLQKAKEKVKTGDNYAVFVPESTESDILAQDIPLNILYEDSSILVINKPSGMVVHPAPGHSKGTLVNGLLHHCIDGLSGIGGIKRPGILHRLDKDTSGVMVVAKNDIAHSVLSSQFHDRSNDLKKLYLTLVWGRPNSFKGIVDAPIARHPRLRQKMAVVNSGKSAQTSYEVIKTFYSKKNSKESISFIKCELHTGRTHQIRVHMQHIGCSIIGDDLYSKGKIKYTCWPDEVINLRRQALHACYLSFKHPVTLEKMEFEAELPEDMQKIINLL